MNGDALLERAAEIIEAALELPVHERPAHIDSLAAGDEALRAEALSLLAAHESAGEFLSEPAAASGAGEQPGATIGHYKLLERLGEGGFGVVYLAEQTEPVRRQVALKVIKLGMDTRQVIARFEQERQALALMDHPNIARVLDAGATAGGRPYFVMELVRGLPITEYCDANRLTPQQRLELFIPVCLAMQHAHQKGIIHRDLKPGNVLVTAQDGRPVPKVIDFGIAKATAGPLTDGTLLTGFRQFLGTPAYMSPEQAELSGDAIDTRSDIYSLGVLLYELMVGATPFETAELGAAAMAEVHRIIRETEPPAPSTKLSTMREAVSVAALRGTEPSRLRAALRGDLDWIVLRCLEKELSRRYATAAELAEDLRRHLAHEPVQAGPPGWFYRTRKLVRRRRGPVLAGAAVCAAVVAGLIATSIGFIRADHERRAKSAALLAEAEQRREAQRQAEIAGAVIDFLTMDLLHALVPQGERASGRGREVTLREALDVAAASIEDAGAPGGRFADQPLVEAAVQLTLGYVYSKLGEFNAAEPHLLRAAALHAAARDVDPAARLRAESRLADLRIAQGRYAEGQAGYEEVLEGRRAALGEHHPETAYAMVRLGYVLMLQGRPAQAEPYLKQAVTSLTESLGSGDAETMGALSALAELYRDQGRLDQALPLTTSLVETAEQALGREHPDTLGYIHNLAALYFDQARYGDARPLMRRVLEVSTRVHGPEHAETLAAMHNLANVSASLGDSAEAERLYLAALQGRQRTLGDDHPDTRNLLIHLAGFYRAQGRFQEAEPVYRWVLRLFDEAGLSETEPALGTRTDLGTTYAMWGRLEEAERILRQTLEVKRRVLGARHPYTRICLSSLATLCEQRGNLAEAAALRQELGELAAPDREAAGSSAGQ